MIPGSLSLTTELFLSLLREPGTEGKLLRLVNERGNIVLSERECQPSDCLCSFCPLFLYCLCEANIVYPEIHTQWNGYHTTLKHLLEGQWSS